MNERLAVCAFPFPAPELIDTRYIRFCAAPLDEAGKYRRSKSPPFLYCSVTSNWDGTILLLVLPLGCRPGCCISILRNQKEYTTVCTNQLFIAIAETTLTCSCAYPYHTLLFSESPPWEVRNTWVCNRARAPKDLLSVSGRRTSLFSQFWSGEGRSSLWDHTFSLRPRRKGRWVPGDQRRPGKRDD